MENVLPFQRVVSMSHKQISIFRLCTEAIIKNVIIAFYVGFFVVGFLIISAIVSFVQFAIK